MSDEQPVPENYIEESQFDDNAIQNTVYVSLNLLKSHLSGRLY